MAKKELRAPVSGPLTVSLRAGMAIAEITASRDVTTASAEISGPQDVIDGIREQMRGGTWEIALPDDGAGGGTIISSFGGGRFVIRGRVGSGVIIGGGNYGTMIQSAGRVVVNGVDVTDVVNARGGDAGPVRVTVRVPAGSSLEAEVEAGGIRTRGSLLSVTAEAVSADVSIEEAGSVQAHAISGDIAIGRLTRSGSLSATSGDIRVSAAAGDVDARSVSGDVTVHATAPVTVRASATSGDIRVTADRGIEPRVRARSVSGRVSQP